MAGKDSKKATFSTPLQIKKLKPGKEKYPVEDAQCRGLFVWVYPSGIKSFVLHYRIGAGTLRTRKKLTIGPVEIGLTTARELARSKLGEVARGIDPAETEKEAKRKAADADTNTVKAICENYQNLAGKELRTAARRHATLKRLVYPAIGHMPIDTLRRGELIRLLDRIKANNGPVMADSVLKFLRKIFNWHAVRDENFHSPIVRGMAQTKPIGRARTRILTDDELRAVWKASETTSPFPAFVRFLLLTAARRSEAAAMTWNEIDGANWVLPAARNKVKRDLVRPLSAAVQSVLEARPEIDGCPYVFTTGRRPLGGFSNLKANFDAQCGVANWTLHDLRRTARSLMSRAGVSADHAERCLGHVIGGVRAAYDRHEYYAEKKQAFDALAALIELIVNPQDNVTPMRKRHVQKA